MLSSSYHLDLAVPIFEDGRWVGCDQINAQDQYIWGVGDYMIHRDKDQADAIGNKDFTYEYTYTTSYYGTRFFFAPVVDAEQFATLYGEERIWGQPHQNHDWLFVGYPDQTRSGARTEPKYPGGIPYYPFDIETPIGAGFGYSEPEVEERTDIEVGDGPDLADVLKGAAIGTAISCNKDLINKAVEKAEAELKNMASSVIEAGSTALEELKEKADGVKANLVAKLPEIPEKITNVHDAITSLDLADLGAVQAFKEKYGDLVDDIDDLLSKFKLPDFDICSLLSISHEKSPSAESPTTAPLEPKRNPSVAQVGANRPNRAGLTKAEGEEATRAINDAWKLIELYSIFTPQPKTQPSYTPSSRPSSLSGQPMGHDKMGNPIYDAGPFTVEEFLSEEIAEENGLTGKEVEVADRLRQPTSVSCLTGEECYGGPGLTSSTGPPDIGGTNGLAAMMAANEKQTPVESEDGKTPDPVPAAAEEPADEPDADVYHPRFATETKIITKRLGIVAAADGSFDLAAAEKKVEADPNGKPSQKRFIAILRKRRATHKEFDKMTPSPSPAYSADYHPELIDTQFDSDRYFRKTYNADGTRGPGNDPNYRRGYVGIR
jgi:hypothetical protein